MSRKKKYIFCPILRAGWLASTSCCEEACLCMKEKCGFYYPDGAECAMVSAARVPIKFFALDNDLEITKKGVN